MTAMKSFVCEQARECLKLFACTQTHVGNYKSSYTEMWRLYPWERWWKNSCWMNSLPWTEPLEALWQIEAQGWTKNGDADGKSARKLRGMGNDTMWGYDCYYSKCFQLTPVFFSYGSNPFVNANFYHGSIFICLTNISRKITRWTIYSAFVFISTKSSRITPMKSIYISWACMSRGTGIFVGEKVHDPKDTTPVDVLVRIVARSTRGDGLHMLRVGEPNAWRKVRRCQSQADTPSLKAVTSNQIEHVNK